jgi:hypothetical protein
MSELRMEHEVLSVPLLAQAEAEHQAALVEERRIRRALAFPESPYTPEDLAAAVARTRKAQGLVDRVRHGLDQVERMLPEAERDLLQAEGALASVVETAKKTIAKAQQRVLDACQERDRLVAHRVAIMGPGAGAGETAL